MPGESRHANVLRDLRRDSKKLGAARWLERKRSNIDELMSVGGQLELRRRDCVRFFRRGGNADLLDACARGKREDERLMRTVGKAFVAPAR